MAGRDLPAAQAAVTVNGTAAGYITVADATPFAAGAKVWMAATGQTSVECVITDIGGGGANTIGLRALPVQTLDLTGSGGYQSKGLRAATYGRSDCTAFTVAQTWTINMAGQFIYSANSVLQ